MSDWDWDYVGKARQRIKNAADQAVFKIYSDAMNRQAESQTAQRGYGLYMP